MSFGRSPFAPCNTPLNMPAKLRRITRLSPQLEVSSPYEIVLEKSEGVWSSLCCILSFACCMLSWIWFASKSPFFCAFWYLSSSRVSVDTSTNRFIRSERAACCATSSERWCLTSTICDEKSRAWSSASTSFSLFISSMTDWLAERIKSCNIKLSVQDVCGFATMLSNLFHSYKNFTAIHRFCLYHMITAIHLATFLDDQFWVHQKHTIFSHSNL